MKEMKLDRKWFEVVKPYCIIKNIKFDDIDPDNEDSLAILLRRIAVAF